MRHETLSKVFLWLFLLNLGTAFGAGLYEHRIVVADWLSLGPDGLWHWNAQVAQQDDTGRRFWGFVTTGPLTVLTLATLFAAWKAPVGLRGWWLGAGVAALMDRLLTFGFFIPTMIRLGQAADSPEAVATATQWSQLNHVRHGLVLVAWILAMKAFTVLYRAQGRAEAPVIHRTT